MLYAIRGNFANFPFPFVIFKSFALPVVGENGCVGNQ